MEDIKDYLDRAFEEHWKRLREEQPTFLDRIEGNEITTEKMHEIIREDAEVLVESANVLEGVLAKLDRCIEMQEKNIQTVEYINDIITT